MMTTDNAPHAAPHDSEPPGSVLVVDDDPSTLRTISEVLQRAGYGAVAVDSAEKATRTVVDRKFDAVISDVAMPKFDGIELLGRLHEHDPTLPVIMVTGGPTIESATEALNLGAVQYLLKPVSPSRLRRAVREAVTLGRVRRAFQKEQRALQDRESGVEELKETFTSAVQQLWMAFQPLVEGRRETIFGYEALLRTDEITIPHPGAFLDLAGELGRLQELGRAVRERIAADAVNLPEGVDIFVNLHPADLLDPNLYNPDAALSKLAHRTVLELTERADLESFSELEACVKRLHGLGFRIALDDVGAGYSGLNTLMRVRPDVAKLDRQLIQAIHTDSRRQRLVRMLADLADELDILLIGEGVERPEERDCLLRCGCVHMQGFLFGRPQPVNQLLRDDSTR